MKRLLTILIAVCAVVALAGCAAAKIEGGAKEGAAQYTVELDANATTGYQWSWQQWGDGYINCVDEEYVLNDAAEGMVGVGGKQMYTFAGAKTGIVNLEFVYKRPWEVNDVADRKTLKIFVDENLNIVVD